MIDPRFLKCVTKKIISTLNKPRFLVEMIGSDNKVYETTICEAEKDLVLFIKCDPQKDIAKLIELIEAYGDMKYQEGEYNTRM